MQRSQSPSRDKSYLHGVCCDLDVVCPQGSTYWYLVFCAVKLEEGIFRKWDLVCECTLSYGHIPEKNYSISHGNLACLGK
jgi:hypothetical protein